MRTLYARSRKLAACLSPAMAEDLRSGEREKKGEVEQKVEEPLQQQVKEQIEWRQTEEMDKQGHKQEVEGLMERLEGLVQPQVKDRKEQMAEEQVENAEMKQEQHKQEVEEEVEKQMQPQVEEQQKQTMGEVEKQQQGEWEEVKAETQPASHETGELLLQRQKNAHEEFLQPMEEFKSVIGAEMKENPTQQGIHHDEQNLASDLQKILPAAPAEEAAVVTKDSLEEREDVDVSVMSKDSTAGSTEQEATVKKPEVVVEEETVKGVVEDNSGAKIIEDERKMPVPVVDEEEELKAMGVLAGVAEQCRAVEKEVEGAKEKMDKMTKAKVTEQLMSLLLRLDTVPSASDRIREQRKRMSRKLSGLLDKVDALNLDSAVDEEKEKNQESQQGDSLATKVRHKTVDNRMEDEKKTMDGMRTVPVHIGRGDGDKDRFDVPVIIRPSAAAEDKTGMPFVNKASGDEWSKIKDNKGRRAGKSAEEGEKAPNNMQELLQQLLTRGVPAVEGISERWKGDDTAQKTNKGREEAMDRQQLFEEMLRHVLGGEEGMKTGITNGRNRDKMKELLFSGKEPSMANGKGSREGREAGRYSQLGGDEGGEGKATGEEAASSANGRGVSGVEDVFPILSRGKDAAGWPWMMAKIPPIPPAENTSSSHLEEDNMALKRMLIEEARERERQAAMAEQLKQKNEELQRMMWQGKGMGMEEDDMAYGGGYFDSYDDAVLPSYYPYGYPYSRAHPPHRPVVVPGRRGWQPWPGNASSMRSGVLPPKAGAGAGAGAGAFIPSYPLRQGQVRQKYPVIY
eukprot:TRINITY_DN2199_c0_g1_i1.p1 TRINITY_DN2199_c0_g1~~TRINITY_DN2199_c0_g1_i1.p1  ORF type:complete len:795 (-),score=337.38 TRINITY_DN2199_c0_g1_i1:109-2493(-)